MLSGTSTQSATHAVEAGPSGVESRDQENRVQLETRLGPWVERRGADARMERCVALDFTDLRVVQFVELCL